MFCAGGNPQEEAAQEHRGDTRQESSRSPPMSRDSIMHGLSRYDAALVEQFRVINDNISHYLLLALFESFVGFFVFCLLFSLLSETLYSVSCVRDLVLM